MTEQQFNELMATLDNLWGGLDEGFEAGYRWLLDVAQEDYALCIGVTREMASGVGRREQDRPFVPKAPEFKTRLDRVKRQLANEARINARLQQVAQLNAARPTPQIPQETVEP